MKTIYKYELKTTDVQTIMMPKNAEILCVQIQNDKPCIWAKIETESTQEKRSFMIVGTGNPMFDTCVYIGTYQIHGGALVFHLFELI